MRILLINVAHPAIGSVIPDDHLPPLGLLSVGGPLIDDGHDVTLIDGDRMRSTPEELAAAAVALRPDAVLFGHSGSTSAHPIIAEVASRIAKAAPGVAIIYGGVFPTYHWREVLAAEPYVAAIVRGEGEETARRLLAALENGDPLYDIPGLAFHGGDGPVATPPAPVIRDLDAYRVGWELIDHADYSYWGGLRAVVIQFSRGCPHLCTYCGQRGFWTRWRHREPVAFAKELARLYREEGVRVINFADENPTTSKKAWRAFLEALIAENVDLILIGTARAGDIVRDADILHLYKKAGWTRILLGLDAIDDATLARVRKGASRAADREAIRLLRRHGIISLAGWVVGFQEDRDLDYLRGFRQLLDYDPDQIILMYATPHRWTPFFEEEVGRAVIQTDQRRWDYKHQVLATRHIPPWRVLLWCKLMEVAMQTRPKAFYRTFLHPDPRMRRSMQWYAKMGRRVWFHEIWRWLLEPMTRDGRSLEAFWGAPQMSEEASMAAPSAVRPTARIAPQGGALRAPSPEGGR